MPRLRSVLEKAHQQEFENPPLLTTPQRQLCFQIDESLKSILRGLELPISQAGFLLQLGYFRATTRFFPLATFREKDWAFVIRRLRFTSASIHPQAYADSTMRYHRQLILEYMQVDAFRGKVQQ